jgi:hypothetical protein
VLIGLVGYFCFAFVLGAVIEIIGLSIISLSHRASKRFFVVSQFGLYSIILPAYIFVNYIFFLNKKQPPMVKGVVR